ncbi:MAG: methionyl-tRNA formyltransferase [Microgenomates group bacterium]
MKITLGYFGSPDFSSYFLEKILNDQDLKKIIDVKLIITQPDRPVGRKQILTPTPVAQIGKKYNLEVLKIDNLKLFKNLKLKIKNLDLAFVYAFSQIIPKELLEVPKYGFWNLHPSLLPKYRGPSPIAFPLILGEEKTGVTIIKMDEKIDHGPIIAQKSLTIEDTDRRPDLEKKLTDLGFEIFKKLILTGLNQLKLKKQDDNKATYTRLLKKQDGFIDFLTLKKVLNNKPLRPEDLPKIIKNLKLKIKNSSKIIYDYFRGLYPWPGLWTILPNGKRLKITDVAFVDNKLILKKVQLEGKNIVDFETFQQAYNLF